MKREKGLSIGIFDSGIGGLTVLHDCMKTLPQATYYYYGDNSRAPYGSRSPEEILTYTREGVVSLAKCGVDAVVLACNTATAVCAEKVRAEFSFPIIGMEPAVKPAAEHCSNVLVLATPRTAESKRLHALVKRFPNCRFTVYGAPRLAGELEAHYSFGTPLSLNDHLPQGEYEGVVLGCTHYLFVKGEIAAHYGVPTFDGNTGTVARLKSVLSERENGKILGTVDPTQTASHGRFIQGKMANSNVIFIGNGADINKNVHFRTFVFR